MKKGKSILYRFHFNPPIEVEPVYTTSTWNLENFARRRPKFCLGEANAEAAQLE